MMTSTKQRKNINLFWDIVRKLHWLDYNGSICFCVGVLFVYFVVGCVVNSYAQTVVFDNSDYKIIMFEDISRHKQSSDKSNDVNINYDYKLGNPSVKSSLKNKQEEKGRESESTVVSSSKKSSFMKTSVTEQTWLTSNILRTNSLSDSDKSTKFISKKGKPMNSNSAISVTTANNQNKNSVVRKVVDDYVFSSRLDSKPSSKLNSGLIDGLNSKLSANKLDNKLSADDLGNRLSADDLGNRLSADDLGNRLSASKLSNKSSKLSNKLISNPSKLSLNSNNELDNDNETNGKMSSQLSGKSNSGLSKELFDELSRKQSEKLNKESDKKLTDEEELKLLRNRWKEEAKRESEIGKKDLYTNILFKDVDKEQTAKNKTIEFLPKTGMVIHCDENDSDQWIIDFSEISNFQMVTKKCLDVEETLLNVAVFRDIKSEQVSLPRIKPNDFVKLRRNALYEHAFNYYGAVYGVSPKLLSLIAYQESRFNPNAVSPKGAIGLMQFMPMTARRFGVNPYDPISSIEGAAKYMSYLLRLFNGNWYSALAGYNAGEATVIAYLLGKTIRVGNKVINPKKIRTLHGIPPYKETMNYVTTIVNNYLRQSTTSK